MNSPQTFAEALDRQLRREPGRPLITFYDHAGDERVELSVTTYANWVAKASGLLADECDLERGDTIALDLPPHWLGPVFLGAAWTLGLIVVPIPEGRQDLPDALVCGPHTLSRWAEFAEQLPVLACSLLPFGVRFANPIPPGVRDVGVEIWGQPDGFTAWDPPSGEDAASELGGVITTQAAMLQAAALGSLLAEGGRLLSVTNPASPPEFDTFIEPLVRSGSLVVVANADPARLDETAAAERATSRHRGR